MWPRSCAYIHAVVKELKARGSSWMWSAVPMLAALLGLAWVGFDGLNGQDAYDYLRLSKAWSAWPGGGPRPVLSEHPHGYPLVGALLGPVLGGEAIALRLVCVVAFIALLGMVHALVKGFVPGRWSTVYVLLACGLSPFLLRASLVVMSDVPALASLFGSFLMTVRWHRGGRVGHLLLAVALSLLSLAFRLAALPMLAVLGCWWAYGLWKVLPPRARYLWITAITVVAAVAAILLWEHIGREGLLSDWSFMNLFRRELRSDDGLLTYTLPNVLRALLVLVHPGFLTMAVVLLPFVQRQDLKDPVIGMAVLLALVYLVFVAGMPYQNDRVYLFAQPFLAVAYAPAFQRVIARSSGPIARLRRTWPLLVVVQAALFVRAMVPFVQQARMEHEVADELRRLGAGQVYTHGMGAALDELLPDANVIELWYGEIGAFTPEAYLVVRPRDLERQWGGLPPAVNWERAREQGLDVLAEREDGWCIARVR